MFNDRLFSKTRQNPGPESVRMDRIAKRTICNALELIRFSSDVRLSLCGRSKRPKETSEM